jgi:hypothetical protein
MNLISKVTVFFVTIAIGLIGMEVGLSLYAFRSFSTASATEQIRTAAEIVRVHLTESMINGVIDKREAFFNRLLDVQGLADVRVMRSPEVVEQFGKGLNAETAADEV